MAKIAGSGLSADDIRQKLASMGYDPSTLDPYLADNGTPAPMPTNDTFTALRALGYPDVIAQQTDTRPTPAPPTPQEAATGLKVFGLDVFSRGSSEFDPVISGALPSTYQLGPGDELVLVVTGQVESTTPLAVSREGFIVVPQVGQMWVNGLTLSQLRDQLYSRLSRVYSGIGTGADARTHFDISIARTHMNQVYITGEVTRPGSYTVFPLASVLNALYQAGGPTANGSFRGVRVMRQGVAVDTVDLYRYLLGGDNLGGIRLEPGDAVYVPVHGRQIAVKGEVNRPAIYELRNGETLADLIRFAGGLTAPAESRRARLERILSAGQRSEPGVDRVVIDVDLAQALANPASGPALQAGDELTIYPVLSDVRHQVTLTGNVWRPGTFQFKPGEHAWDLIHEAEGLLPDAYLANAQISRLNRENNLLTNIRFSLDTAANGAPVANPLLQEDDILRIFSRSSGDLPLAVSVDGAVLRPDTMSFETGLTLRDAIIRVGGLRRFADPELEISRFASPEERAAGKVASLFHVRVDSTYFVADGAAAYYLGNPQALAKVVGGGEAATFKLAPNDRVLVRVLAEFKEPAAVFVTGEVVFPATYTLSERTERLRHVLVDRAGGLTKTAAPNAFQLIRHGDLVNIDLPKVLRDSTSDDNVILFPGDSLIVPRYNPVVVVRGAVNSPTTVLYKKGASLSYYVRSAGGYSRNADESRTNVRYPNGEGATVSSHLHFFHSSPDVRPGTAITVPFVSTADRTAHEQLISNIVQILASLATVTLVFIKVK